MDTTAFFEIKSKSHALQVEVFNFDNDIVFRKDMQRGLVVVKFKAAQNDAFFRVTNLEV